MSHKQINMDFPKVESVISVFIYFVFSLFISLNLLCFLLFSILTFVPFLSQIPPQGKGNKKGNMIEKTSQITATYACYPYFIYFSIFLLLLLPFIENPVKLMLPQGNSISNNKVTSSFLLLKWDLQFQLFRDSHKTIAVRFVGDLLRRTDTHPTSLLAIITKMHCSIAHNPVGHSIVHNIANLF